VCLALPLKSSCCEIVGRECRETQGFEKAGLQCAVGIYEQSELSARHIAVLRLRLSAAVFLVIGFVITGLYSSSRSVAENRLLSVRAGL